MSQIRIEVAGVSYAEAQELARLLEQVEGIESVGVPWRTPDRTFDLKSTGLLIPEIKASSEVQALFLVFAEPFLKSFAEEAAKDIYMTLKGPILQKLGEWWASRDPEQRARIVFGFDDEHMLVNKGEGEK